MQKWFRGAVATGHEAGQWERPQGRFGTCASLHQRHCAQEEVWQYIACQIGRRGRGQGMGSSDGVMHAAFNEAGSWGHS